MSTSLDTVLKTLEQKARSFKGQRKRKCLGRIKKLKTDVKALHETIPDLMTKAFEVGKNRDAEMYKIATEISKKEIKLINDLFLSFGIIADIDVQARKKDLLNDLHDYVSKTIKDVHTEEELGLINECSDKFRNELIMNLDRDDEDLIDYMVEVGREIADELHSKMPDSFHDYDQINMFSIKSKIKEIVKDARKEHKTSDVHLFEDPDKPGSIKGNMAGLDKLIDTLISEMPEQLQDPARKRFIKFKADLKKYEAEIFDRLCEMDSLSESDIDEMIQGEVDLAEKFAKDLGFHEKSLYLDIKHKRRIFRDCFEDIQKRKAAFDKEEEEFNSMLNRHIAIALSEKYIEDDEELLDKILLEEAWFVSKWNLAKDSDLPVKDISDPEHRESRRFIVKQVRNQEKETGIWS